MTALSLTNVAPDGRSAAAGVLAFVLCAVILVPSLGVGGVNVGGEDVMALLLLPVAVALALLDSGRRFSPMLTALALVWTVIIAHGIFFGVMNAYSILGFFKLPTEMWQYVKRGIFFFTFVYLINEGLISSRQAVLMLLLILFGTTVVGLLQLGSGALSTMMSALYARSDVHLENSVQAILNIRRSVGISGHPTAWGGFSAFVAGAALALLLTPARFAQRLTSKHQLIGLIIFVFAVINVAFSGSRAAIIALTVGILIQLTAGFWAWRSVLGSSVKIIVIVGTAAFAVVYFALDRLAFLFFRFISLLESGGGARTEQIQAGINLLDSWPAWLHGVGNAVQRRYGVSYGTEVEPVYLTINYGLFGAALRYFLLALVIVTAVRVARHGDDIWGRYAGVATVTVACTYLVFSAGYFFFQELVAGVAPWILFGICVGAYEKSCARMYHRN